MAKETMPFDMQGKCRTTPLRATGGVRLKIPGGVKSLPVRVEHRHRPWSGNTKRPRGEWRRERDSNPRRAYDPYTLSRAAPSTARTPLRAVGTLVCQLGGRRPPGRSACGAAMILKGRRAEKLCSDRRLRR